MSSLSTTSHGAATLVFSQVQTDTQLKYGHLHRLTTAHIISCTQSQLQTLIGRDSQLCILKTAHLPRHRLKSAHSHSCPRACLHTFTTVHSPKTVQSPNWKHSCRCALSQVCLIKPAHNHKVKLTTAYAKTCAHSQICMLTTLHSQNCGLTLHGHRMGTYSCAHSRKYSQNLGRSQHTLCTLSQLCMLKTCTCSQLWTTTTVHSHNCICSQLCTLCTLTAQLHTLTTVHSHSYPLSQL